MTEPSRISPPTPTGGAPRVVLGTSTYAAPGDGGRRQAAAMAWLRTLRGVRVVNVQWPDDVHEVEGIDTIPALRSSSVAVSGATGVKKPVITEVWDALCAEAERVGAPWFAFTNSDVRVLQPLIDRVVAEPRDAWIVCRTDTDPETGADLKVLTEGIDVFVVRAAWWRANRRRFRAYLMGEPVWDNVFAAILLAHGDGEVLARGAWARHEDHPAAWRASPFAEYVRLLAALDRPYFTLWARYHHDLLALRARGATEDEERAMRREVFRLRASPVAALVQAARALKARLRFRRHRAGG